MMTRTILLLGALAVVVAGCDSEVTGGGGGAGGGSGGAGSGTSGGTTQGPSTTTGNNTATTGSGNPTGGQGGADVTISTTAGPGGGGGGNALGACEFNGGSASSVGSGGDGPGTTSCEVDYICDGGNVDVFCTNDGNTESCECSLGGAYVGTCIDADESGCTFPQNCCFDLLGGQAEPNPGPYGQCDESGGSATGAGGGGSTFCGSYNDCDGGSNEIECEDPNNGDPVACECLDGQGFLLGTCSQATLDCGYEAGCCFAIFN